MLVRLAVVVALVISTTSPVAATPKRPPCDWTQWGQNAAHTGQLCTTGQRDLRLLARLTVDPFAEQEAGESQSGGYIPVHLPTPLVDRDGNVYVLRKTGTYVSCDSPGSGQPAPCGTAPGNLERQNWTIQASRWHHDRLVPTWSFTSDWKPSRTVGKETLFQPAMTDQYLYVPGAGGTVFQLDKNNGHTIRRINPFGTTVDPTAFTSGGLTLDTNGTLFYNTLRSERDDAHGWLVRVTRDQKIRMADYRTLIPGAPRPTDLCYGEFTGDLPFPPPPQPDGTPTLPPQSPCLSQRAAISTAPAVGADGTVYTVTRAHNRVAGRNYGYLVALNRDLTLKWATSLRGILNDGCGVLVPYGTDDPFNCRPGAAHGVDPYTNLQPAGGVDDNSTASPVALPDGSVVYGTRNFYNDRRGHLMKFDPAGRYLTNFDYGWDITPAVYPHDGTYSLYIKDLHYDGGPYNVTRLDADLRKEWSHASTETRTCERLPDDTVSCVDEGRHPDGFEWCISAPAVDRDGTLYGLSADGHFYVIDNQGRQLEKVFLSKTIASAYTPVSLDPRGRIYAQNNGELYVLGNK